MRIPRWLTFLAAIFLSFQIARGDDAPKISREYTASIEITTASSPTPIKCDMYVSLTKIRKDTTIGNVEMKIIIDLPKQVSASIMPATKLVLISRMPDGTPSMTSGLPSDGVWKNLGPDTANGVACTKYEYTDNTTGKVSDYWINGEIMVQTGTPDGSEKVIYTSFVPGEPDPAVFDLSMAGYKVIRMNKPATSEGFPNISK